MELTLFVIIGAVAILSAAMMLISENAVYSALFLILNFACIAFFFLMLNAPFLAMVQITVYAGAIMVLFLFVIMLLGAERIATSSSRFPWMVPVVIVLGLVFLITASMAIVNGEIDLTDPVETQPHIRVVHVLDGVPQVDVYLNDALIAENLDFRATSDFESQEPGRYTVAVFAAGADPQSDTPLIEKTIRLKSDEALSLTAIGRSGDIRLVSAVEDISQIEDSSELRIMAINALPEWSAVDVWNDAGSRDLLIENLAYGEASEVEVIDKGTYSIGLYPTGNDRDRLAALKEQKFDSATSVLLVFSEQREPDNSFMDVIISLETDTRPAFGGPEDVGQRLFSRYVLPFEMVALLLLVAMIGAIVLTHETLTPPRRRVVRRLANPPAGLDQPITGEPGQ
ncbi:MAG: NADH-quinone oxidoreductase subunit J [Anaerolineae bacterium]|nr:NADH-quinone oxidoreductase subunit J [Anaerolineae bacterium]